jgi:hypothetical protein
VLSVRELAGGPVSAAPDAAGRPERPLAVVDLDSAGDAAELAAARAAAQASTAGLIGVTGWPDERTAGLRAALAVTLSPQDGGDRTVVAAPDPAGAAQALAARAAAWPLAAVTAAWLLRQTAALDVGDGLRCESAAYSMLLAGPEFARWLEQRGPGRPARGGDGDPVLVRRSGDQLDIRLSRERRRNAVSAAMRDRLVEAFSVAVADPRVHVELTAAGPDFSAGGDLDEFGTAPDPVAAHVIRTERSVGWLIYSCGPRVTARLHGSAAGAGIELPAFAGRVVAHPATRIILPELSLGLVPGAGGTVSVTRRIGRWRTAWLILSGEWIDAATAWRWGLADAVEENRD